MTKRVHHADHESLRERCLAEMAQRRAKPNPAARPPSKESVALAALRASLQTASGAERERIARLIARTESLYRPPGVNPSARLRDTASRPIFKPGTVREYAAELLQHVDHLNEDGRMVGLTLAEILRRVAERFPESRLNVKELERIRDIVRDVGGRLPIRARTRASELPARPVTDTGKPTRRDAGASAAGRADRKAA